uniref:Uncharacterized protein n=1 Tax=Craspedostauros australis TaxID=1486917 RepID=A0A7R9WLY5_9STRA|mmetsp:Transcript_10574/g.29147  ORF Transcript_10574/g.29147 Transcript_10574/m.29147 type:complete len:133 (+) Transcript_10574:1-399(+)
MGCHERRMGEFARKHLAHKQLQPQEHEAILDMRHERQRGSMGNGHVMDMEALKRGPRGKTATNTRQCHGDAETDKERGTHTNSQKPKPPRTTITWRLRGIEASKQVYEYSVSASDSLCALSLSARVPVLVES